MNFVPLDCHQGCLYSTGLTAVATRQENALPFISSAPPVVVGCDAFFVRAVILNLSSLSYGKARNSCLFFHSTSFSIKLSASCGGGGGWVILVMRYAVEASATPYIRTPTSGILRKMKKAMAKPYRTPSRLWNQARFWLRE